MRLSSEDMTTQNLLPPVIPGVQLEARLLADGYGVIAAADVAARAGQALGDLLALAPAWNRLTPDAYLRDGGNYRFRRHASLRLTDDGKAIAQRVQRAHWQPLDYNALHGGFLRWFAPVTDATLAEPGLHKLLFAFGQLAVQAAGHPLPFVELHQFRIDTATGIGRPTPEGAHRDGVDFVAVILIDRVDLRGGESRIFEADGPAGIRFTLLDPGSAVLLDDARVIHETTPLQPDGVNGHRDTLVLTWRREGFLDPQ